MHLSRGILTEGFSHVEKAERVLKLARQVLSRASAPESEFRVFSESKPLVFCFQGSPFLTVLGSNGNMVSRKDAKTAQRSGPRAEVAELADALHSGCSARQGVEVRLLSSALPPF